MEEKTYLGQPALACTILCQNLLRSDARRDQLEQGLFRNEIPVFWYRPNRLLVQGGGGRSKGGPPGHRRARASAQRFQLGA